MPVVTPSRASTETVKAVPSGASLCSVIWRRPSSSQRSSVRQRQIRPRPCVAMKLIASGVANWAAMTRSPSFSRFGSSTTTTNLPLRTSSIASSIDANVRGSAARRHAQIVAPVSLSTYLARTSASRLTSSPAASRAERRHRERVRDERDREAGVVERGDRERDAVDGDRALLDAVAEDARRARRSRRALPSPSGSTERTRPTPSTWPWT